MVVPYEGGGLSLFCYWCWFGLAEARWRIVIAVSLGPIYWLIGGCHHENFVASEFCGLASIFEQQSRLSQSINPPPQIRKLKIVTWCPLKLARYFSYNNHSSSAAYIQGKPVGTIAAILILLHIKQRTPDNLYHATCNQQSKQIARMSMKKE